jgi:uncharacterized membrane protein YeaQ/YmgE (transglycosylase-associated protein family)
MPEWLAPIIYGFVGGFVGAYIQARLDRRSRT